MPHARHPARRGIVVAAAAAVPVLLGLTACAPSTEATPTPTPAFVVQQPPTYDNVAVTQDLAFPTADGFTQLLDVCHPADAAAPAERRAIVLIHGGSWREGDKASTWWRSTCEWLASEGFVVFSTNYRLAPQHPFPAAVVDVRAAIEWVRQPAQVATYGHDPARIAAFGGSAGGNLASLVGTLDEGDLASGSRVAAVVTLSAPTDLSSNGLKLGTPPTGFDKVQLDYLGCSDYLSCDTAAEASPQTYADPSDPPFLIAHSLEEYIPVGHARSLALALEDADVPTTLLEVPGTAHSIALLGRTEPTPLRETIVEFLREALA